MKAFVVLAVSASLFLSVPAHCAAPPAAEPGALEYATQIVDTILPPERRDEMMMGVMRTMSEQMRTAIMGQLNDAGLRQIIDSYMASELERVRPTTEKHMPLILKSMAQAYVREFSLDELRQISGFARTPAGLHYLSRSTALLADPDIAAANRAYFVEVTKDSMDGQQALRISVANYLAKHPDVAKKIAQQNQAGQE